MTPPKDWEEAGRAWRGRAADRAYLFEPYARPANEAVFDQLGVGEGARLLDIACGSGLAAQIAARRDAVVAGISASEALVSIARARTPNGDFRVADMFALPFPGDTARPGVIEEMLVSAGFVPRERGTVTVINEWPDAELAVRALAAADPSVPAIQAVGFGPFCEALREVIGPLHIPGAGIRIASELGWITAELRPH